MRRFGGRRWAATNFPEDLKVFEDIGIAKRILDRGWKIVYEPAASVYHSHQHTTLGLFKRYFDLGYTFRQLGIWNEGTKASLLHDAWKMMAKVALRQKWERAKSAGLAEAGPGEVGGDVPGSKRKISASSFEAADERVSGVRVAAEVSGRIPKTNRKSGRRCLSR